MIAHSLDARVWTILMDFSIILSCTDSNLKDTRTREGLKWCACLPEGNNQAKRNNEMIEDYIFVCLEINLVTDFFLSQISLESLVTAHRDHLSCYVPTQKIKKTLNFTLLLNTSDIGISVSFSETFCFLSVVFFLFVRLTA